MNLIEGLMAEIERNEELARVYDTIPTGALGAMLIRQDLKRARAAIASGDVIEEMRVYDALKNNE